MELKEEKLDVWLENMKLKRVGTLDKDCVQKDQRETAAAEGESFIRKSRKSLICQRKF